MTTAVDRGQLILQLAHDVTLRSDPPYAELETALTALVDAIAEGKSPGLNPDWAAVIGEALNLRPQH